MKLSKVFTKTQKDIAGDEKSVNAQLLLRAGFVDKLMSGVYSFLPFGFLVLKKIENVIREEMNKAGGQEVLLPALSPKENWDTSGRWQYEEMFKVKSRSGKDYGLGWTHEEIIVPLVKRFVKSYRDLPVFVYQIQDKFRDEFRAKSGLLRGIEFLMKDFYSFHRSEQEMDRFYEDIKKAYFAVFGRCGLKNQTFLTLASGGTFSGYSHEFQTITKFGEDIVYLCRTCSLGINKEIIQQQNFQCPECGNKDLTIEKAIEVGNIFKLKDRFTKAFDFVYKDEDGQSKGVEMGCYGIGLGRLMGSIVEVHHDERGIIWPESVAPYAAHLVSIFSGRQARVNRKIKSSCDKFYTDLQRQSIEVLYDDREEKSAGEKFADADLIGVPYRVVVSERTLKSGSVEIKQRNKDKAQLLKVKRAHQFLKSKIKDKK